MTLEPCSTLRERTLLTPRYKGRAEPPPSCWKGLKSLASSTSCIPTKTALRSPCHPHRYCPSTMKMPPLKEVSVCRPPTALKPTTTPICWDNNLPIDPIKTTECSRVRQEVAPSMIQLLVTWDHLGSIGKKAMVTQDTECCIKDKTFSVHTCVTGYTTESCSKWEQKGMGNSSPHEKYLHVHAPQWWHPQSKTKISTSSPKTCPSISQWNKPWIDWKTPEFWPKWPDSGCSMHTFQSSWSSYRQSRNCPMQCTSYTKHSMTEPVKWCCNWRLPSADLKEPDVTF
jgi:hypothetical protein